MTTQKVLEKAHRPLVPGPVLEVAIDPGFKFIPGCHIVWVGSGEPAQYCPLATG